MNSDSVTGTDLLSAINSQKIIAALKNFTKLYSCSDGESGLTGF